MRVIGIDPGLRNLGWGVIDVAGCAAHAMSRTASAIPTADGDLAERLLQLHRQLTEVLRAIAPEAAAVEHTFVNKDAVATLKLGQARGIALLVPAQFGLAVGEYAPNAVKKTVVGVGHAAKVQVDHMVRLHLPGVRDRRAGCGRCAGGRDLPRASPAIGRAALQRGVCEGGAMIGKLSGRLDWRGPDHVLIDVRGVGYIVHVSDRTLAAMPGVGEAVALYTELVVREDLLQLFGFPTLLEKEWHRLLTTVQGIGAKAALAILGTLGAEGVARAITLGDARAIQAAPGVGPKLAQRVVLELKAKAPVGDGAGRGAGRRGAGRGDRGRGRAADDARAPPRLPRPSPARLSPRMRSRRWSTSAMVRAMRPRRSRPWRARRRRRIPRP